MNEATPPETPVWSTGVLVNFGGAEINKQKPKINLSSKHKICQGFKIIKKEGNVCFSSDSVHLQEKALKNN